MNCHCMNKPQNRTSTTELVTDTKVVISTDMGSEIPQPQVVSEITPDMPVQESTKKYQVSILGSSDIDPDKSTMESADRDGHSPNCN